MPRRVPSAAWCAAALAASAAAAQTRPATRPTLAELQAKAFADELKADAALPPVPSGPVADVARLRLDGPHLAVRTAVPATAGAVHCRVTVTDLPGLCDVTHTALRRHGEPSTDAPPDVLLFDWSQFDQPGLVEVGTTVAVFPASTQLSRVTEAADGGVTQLQLTELRNPPAPGEAGVRLRFSGAAAADGRPPAADVDVAADTFLALCRLHPAEVARYLEPVLRGLHADAAVLPADPTLAYQVFAAAVPPDPATDARVRQLVAKLDADDFTVRDAAGEQLRALGPIAAVAVARLDPARLSPEQQARTAALVRHARPVPDADAARLAGDADFLLNCLNDSDPFVVNQALAGLGRVTGHAVPFDPSLAGQPRRDAVWALRQRLTTAASTTRP